MWLINGVEDNDKRRSEMFLDEGDCTEELIEQAQAIPEEKVEEEVLDNVFDLTDKEAA